MGEENETQYFKWSTTRYLRRGGGKSHLIKEGTYNKNYCPEPTVFPKRSNPDGHLIKIKKRQQQPTATTKSTTNQSYIPSLFPEIKQEITFFCTDFVNYMSI